MWKFFKYSAIVFFLKKYSKKINLSLAVLILTALMLLVVDDVKEYLLEINDKTDIIYLMLFKWLWLIAVGLLLWRIIFFKKKTKEEKAIEAQEAEEHKQKEAQNARFASLREKEKLRSRGDMAIEQAKRRKSTPKIT